jgi:beta propeller repeat protein
MYRKLRIYEIGSVRLEIKMKIHKEGLLIFTFILIFMLISIVIISNYYSIIWSEKEKKITSVGIKGGSIDVNNNIIVYDDDPYPYITIYDLSKSRKTNIIKAYHGDLRIHNNYIVWLGGLDLPPPYSKSQIIFYDIQSKEIKQVTTEKSDAWSDPAIYKDKIIWTDGRHDTNPNDNKTEGEIYLYDISTGEEQRVTYSLSWKKDPDIYGDKIVWRDYNYTNDHWSMKIYYMKSSELIELQGGAARIWDDRIVYPDINQDGYIALFTFSLSNSKIREIPKSEYGITHFDIYDDKVVWEDYYKVIYLYDISKNKLTTIENTYEEYDVWSPAIWGNKVVWASNKDGNDNIYIYIIPEDTILGLEPNIFYISMTALIIILILIIILLIRLKRKKKKQSLKMLKSENEEKA